MTCWWNQDQAVILIFLQVHVDKYVSYSSTNLKDKMLESLKDSFQDHYNLKIPHHLEGPSRDTCGYEFVINIKHITIPAM